MPEIAVDCGIGLHEKHFAPTSAEQIVMSDLFSSFWILFTMELWQAILATPTRWFGKNLVSTFLPDGVDLVYHAVLPSQEI